MVSPFLRAGIGLPYDAVRNLKTWRDLPYTLQESVQFLATTINAWQWRIEKNLKRGRQFISSVLIYRKCAQRNICLLHGKSGFLKKYEPIGGRPPPSPSPFESATHALSELYVGPFLLTQSNTIHKYLVLNRLVNCLPPNYSNSDLKSS